MPREEGWLTVRLITRSGSQPVKLLKCDEACAHAVAEVAESLQESISLP